MIRLSVRSLAARPLRTALSALAIVLGVALVSAALVLGATLKRGADALSASAYDGTDAAIVADVPFRPLVSDGQQAPPIPASVLDTARATAGVGVAAGNVSDRAVLLGADGRRVNQDGMTFAEGVDASSPAALKLTPFALRDGRWPRGGGEVAVEAGTADRAHVGVGDDVRIAARGPAQTFRVSAIVRFSGVDSLGGKTGAVVFDLPTAQRLFDKEGRYDSVLVAARDGVDPATLRRDLAAALPAQKVTTAAAEDRFSLDELSTVVSVVRTVLTAFGILAVLIGAFTILNTLSIAVAQRTRELALLRMVGGSRAQARRLILVEALLLGLAASVTGLVAGFGLAKLLDGVLASVGLDLPHSGLVLAPSAVIVALAVGTLATLLAGLVPARRATRVTPIAALAQAGGAQRRRGRFVAPLVGAVAWPGAKLGGVAGTLARRNALRNPGRTTVTAAALAVGVALMTVVLVATAGFRAFERSSLEHRIQAQQVVYAADGWSPIPDTIERAVADTPGVTAVTSLRQDGALAFGGRERINAVDPATARGLFDFDWVHGSPATLSSLGADSAVLDSGFASEHHLAVGDRFTVTSATGRQVALVVRGIERSPVLDMMNLGPITVSAQAFAAGGWASADRTITLVDTTDPGALARTVARFPEAQVDPTAAWIDTQLAGLDGVVALFGVLLALCVLVSLLGIANAMVLATFERTRELGVLRALGMSRRQLRRMVRAESIATALLGAVLGAAAGLALAAVITSLLADQGLRFVVPTVGLVVFAVLAVLAGVVAAALPARRAARMDVLAALAYE
jgi:putative ABC transport system permease protein